MHEPWELAPEIRAALDYPEPIVDHRVAVAEYKATQRELSARRGR